MVRPGGCEMSYCWAISFLEKNRLSHSVAVEELGTFILFRLRVITGYNYMQLLYYNHN